jgi:single-strand DNA-binding protein
MKSLRNTVTLIGRVGQNPEIINFDNGGSIAKFSLATTDSWKNKKGEKVEDTQWHNLVVNNGLVKVVEGYVEKGKEICVEGRIVTRKWEDKDGKAHYTTEIQVNDLLLLGGKK